MKLFKWNKEASSAASLFILSLSLVACQNQEVLQMPVQPEPTPAPVQEEHVEESNTSLYTAPLTGLPVDEAITRRPLAVMINNAPAARPQSGLSSADIILEVLAEGGITRFIAIFQSEGGAETVGPVRSIRPYLIELGESYDGVLVHAGGSPEAYSILQRQQKQHMDEISNGGPYFWRSSDRKAPHNLYTSADKLREGSDIKGYSHDFKSPVYIYNEEGATSAGEAVKQFDIHYLLDSYRVTYDYDEVSGRYMRMVNGKADQDMDNETQLGAANIIVAGADHKVLDSVGRLSVNLEQGGEAMLFQKGKMIRGQWVKKQGDIIRFVQGGSEVALVPGKTFISIVPNQPEFSSHVKLAVQQ
ncbi:MULTISPECIES: DUF3048 domain-containing protein [unclassified Paenibacillus]|uniref:DUF3048 domain-containing protein n=1 Tax=unclassified Paenibacillus TaxID=185978 RepID=UPI000CFD8253|nr:MULTISPECIES: DUF3048 domain-containing protein [unclassified Paenibacillus]PQZ99013.1 hypothetical protein CQ043_28100 [Paenibacillus sp. MYb63]PRA43986.1 hypothetical protein CQ061_27535 [Paenibacillus sp. MYb67]